MKEIKCYIEKHYKVNHSKATEMQKNTFATVGRLFDRQPVCAWCIQRLAVVADAYGYSQQNVIRGNAVNVDAKVPFKELVDKSPLKAVFTDYNIEDIKHNLDRNLYELEPTETMRPSIESEMERIRKEQMFKSG
jgi:hypothetical protein